MPRASEAAIFLLLVTLLVSPTAPAGAVGEPAAETIYLVTGDPRLCPSPVCGGAWVRAANRDVTVCADGQEREACYVASVESGSTQSQAMPQSIFPMPMLARGRIEPRDYPGFGNLGVLIVSARWQAATANPPNGGIYLVRDNGIRCIAAPCFSYTALLVNVGTETTLSALDLTKVGATPEQLAAAQQALSGPGLPVAGSVEPQPNAGPAGEGRVLVASQFYLVAPPTQAIVPKVITRRQAATALPANRVRAH